MQKIAFDEALILQLVGFLRGVQAASGTRDVDDLIRALRESGVVVNIKAAPQGDRNASDS